MLMETIKEALDILTEDATPRDTLSLFGASPSVARHNRTHPAGYRDVTSRAMCVILDAAERKGVVPERLRAACHLLWGQPCYAGRGALTLCEVGDRAGALTAATGGDLEVSDAR